MKLHFTCCLFLLKLCIIKAFVNIVLTEEDEMVVPLCLIVIALAMQHLNGPLITKFMDKEVYSTKKYIWGPPCFGRGASK